MDFKRAYVDFISQRSYKSNHLNIPTHIHSFTISFIQWSVRSFFSSHPPGKIWRKLKPRKRENHPSNHSSIHPFLNPTIPPSIHSSIQPFLHPSIPPSIHSSIQPFLHPSIPPSNHSSIQPFLNPSIHPSIHSSIHSFIHPSFHPSNHSSIQQFIHPSNNSSIHSSINSSNYPSMHASICSFLHSFINQPMHSFIHRITHQSINSTMHASLLPWETWGVIVANEWLMFLSHGTNVWAMMWWCDDVMMWWCAVRTCHVLWCCHVLCVARSCHSRDEWADLFIYLSPQTFRPATWEFNQILSNRGFK